ncbi:polyprenyl synthetase family protein [Dactylosporangium fulvum]|uniref:Polyprenyl synthetase family protein n=1 Tax=Dactylosporangium fulvum TaxID=53359 RepID=A0ABY5VS83_9ACTN|nr:polyprenyl synthetase family protein [Dactylosporangium fulvum]UWP80067.1 polyprenyl synthetase family protein [Dactylosporangium fulvum]
MNQPNPVLTATAPHGSDTLARCRDLVTPALRNAVDRLHPDLARLAAYTFGWADGDASPRPDGGAGGGKSIRPALALLSAEAVGGAAEAAVPGAVAVELVHAFSLVHDDIMDGDERRRHRATVWKAFGIGPALLVGDALLALATEVLTRTPDAVAPAASDLLSGMLVDLANGQAEDLAFELRPWTGPEAVTLAEYQRLALLKTGALLGCATGLGALLGGAPAEVVSAMTQFGRQLGVAFQAVDDLLGIWGDPATTGKPVFNDLRARKKTLPVVAALAGSSPAATELAALLGTPHTDERALRRAAALIDAAGGRTFATEHARRYLTGAQQSIDAAAVNLTAAAELRRTVAFIVDRAH